MEIGEKKSISSCKTSKIIEDNYGYIKVNYNTYLKDIMLLKCYEKHFKRIKMVIKSKLLSTVY